MFNFIVELVRAAMNTPEFNLGESYGEQPSWKSINDDFRTSTSFSPTSIARICSASDLATISESRIANTDTKDYKKFMQS
jgi:hypothetical protein